MHDLIYDVNLKNKWKVRCWRVVYKNGQIQLTTVSMYMFEFFNIILVSYICTYDWGLTSRLTVMFYDDKVSLGVCTYTVSACGKSNSCGENAGASKVSCRRHQYGIYIPSCIFVSEPTFTFVSLVSLVSICLHVCWSVGQIFYVF